MLVGLINIGRKRAIYPHSQLYKGLIEPLALDDSTVGFAKVLLDRIRDLQSEHCNKGDPLVFDLSRQNKEKLYSCLWEYARELERGR